MTAVSTSSSLPIPSTGTPESTITRRRNQLKVVVIFYSANHAQSLLGSSKIPLQKLTEDTVSENANILNEKDAKNCKGNGLLNMDRFSRGQL